ncbi:sacsin N-terminal ATP-binding-like domain-containing protein [Pseudomonas viridiflava]|uniref:sacsin N-terminal ATP-binding-like domain-containing protein n=1 Tax=Pseudomonas viridiflava TaxID=33069 RepID=UPI000F048E20|nr:hypothetical protein [Pseudomonas viridiflava]
MPPVNSFDLVGRAKGLCLQIGLAKTKKHELGDAMALQREQRIFTAEDSQWHAREVVHHDPATRRAFSFVPLDGLAADAGVAALSTQLKTLPASIRNALANAESSAAHISEDRLQGLAELIQNADDLGATSAEFVVDVNGARLMFRHNGAGLTLHDVWALAIPWLSLKLDDPNQLGRFGIGLKTLHALSDILEVHQGYFRVRYQANDLSVAKSDVTWPDEEPTDAMTTFVIPLEADVSTAAIVTQWLKHWSDAGLVFLSSLNTVTLRGATGDVLARLHMDRTAPETVKSTGGEMTRRIAKASDSREWVIYSRSVPVPTGYARARKAHTRYTPIAVAFSLVGLDAGHLHVGLPVRPIGLPFRMMAQFDPLTSRRDISDDPWNHALVEPLSALWLDAVLEHFERNPAAAWAAIPLNSDLDDDGQTIGRLRAEIDRHLMENARTTFANKITLQDGQQRYHLHELSYEVPELEHVLTPHNVKTVAGTAGTVTAAVRSGDKRWRDALEELRDIGAQAPTLVEVVDALQLLDDVHCDPAFVADLVAIAVEKNSTNELENRSCLVLNDSARITPIDVIGLGLLLPEEAANLWDILDIGRRLHPAYRERPGWKSVREWLHRSGRLLIEATDKVALGVLAKAGNNDVELNTPLTDEQADGLRKAFEQLSIGDRQTLGEGIGRAVRFAAITYDEAGKKILTAARPSEAYIIERETNAWKVAAGKTPGLIWLHSRYAEQFRAESGREGIGAQRLFRYLGAETAPRLATHSAHVHRYAYTEPGVRHISTSSPQRRNLQMKDAGATYTLADLVSPHLDAVLSNIASEKKTTDRVRRASAVLNSLNRAWDRLVSDTKVRAAIDYRSWQIKGHVDAWWVAKAASIPWLTSASGAATAPDHLRIRTAATEAFFGANPAGYLNGQLDNVAYQEVLTTLGVAGDPRPDQLLDKLRAIRDEYPNDATATADHAAPLYRALATQLSGRGSSRRPGQLTLSALRSEFGKGEGLIATNVGWRRPSVVRSGRAVFGPMLPFVPAIDGTDPLWKVLEIRPPDVTDAKETLRKLAKRNTLTEDQRLVMLEALRILAGAAIDQRGKLARSPVWVGDRWLSVRPIFAVENPLIAGGLAGQIPVWSPGGALAQLESLVEPYGLTRIDASQAWVKGAEYAEYDPELTHLFSNAVSNLRRDLALSDSCSEASIRVSWDALSRFNVCVKHDLTVEFADLLPGKILSFKPKAWIDKDAATFYISNPEDLGDPDSGAYAIATVFASDMRRMAHDWLAAWAASKAGHRAEAIKTAASLESEQKQARAEREDAAGVVLLKMSELSESRRQKKLSTKLGGKQAESAEEENARKQSPKTLVDLSKLKLKNPAGQIVEGSNSKGDVPPDNQTKDNPLLQDVDRNRPKAKRKAGAGAPARNYTQEEQESLGADICRWVLGLDETEIVDIRNQHNVGADAIDMFNNFYEYKVYAGAIPDVIRLEPSQIERARTTPNFFLVVIGNLQAGVGDPEVRIITNPLDKLALRPTASVQFAGVLAAKALTYRFTSENSGEE